MASIYSSRSNLSNGVFTTRHFNNKVLKVQKLISYNGKEVDVDRLDQNEIVLIKHALARMNSKVSEHTQSIDELESANNNNAIDISDNKQAIDILVGNMKEVTDSIEDHEQNINNALEDINSNLGLIQNLSTNITDLSTRVETLENNSGSNTDIGLLQTALGHVIDKVDINTDNITDLTTRVETLENNPGNGCECGDTITDLTTRVETLENNPGTGCNCADTITDLTTRVETLENNSGSSGSSGSNTDIEIIKKALSNVKSQADTNEDNITDLTTRVETLENNSGSGTSTDFETRILALENTVATAEGINGNADITLLQLRLTHQNTQLTEIDSRLEALENSGTSSMCICSKTLNDFESRIVALENAVAITNGSGGIEQIETAIENMANGLTNINLRLETLENNSSNAGTGSRITCICAKTLNDFESRIVALEDAVVIDDSTSSAAIIRLKRALSIQNNHMKVINSRLEVLENNGTSTCNCAETLTDLTSRIETLENNSGGSSGSGTVNCDCTTDIENINALVGTKTNTAEDTVIYRQKLLMENINKLCQVNALIMVVMKTFNLMDSQTTQLDNAGKVIVEVKTAMNELLAAWADE